MSPGVASCRALSHLLHTCKSVIALMSRARRFKSPPPDHLSQRALSVKTRHKFPLRVIPPDGDPQLLRKYCEAWRQNGDKQFSQGSQHSQ